MANWLSRATSLFHQPTPPPEPFEVECDCGAKVHGQRTRTFQRPSCAVCERPVFVLPTNVYPRSKSKPTIKKKSVPTKPSRVIEDSEAEKGSQAAATKSHPGRRGSSPTVGAREIIPGVLRQEPSRPLITPLRLVLGLVIAMGGFMIVGLWHRNRLEQARIDVTRAADAGFVALREGDFRKASNELERARGAVDLLGRNDPASNEIRRGSREATALAHLAVSTLSEILQGALSVAKPGATEPLMISSLYQDAWILFDTDLIPADEGTRKYTIDAPLQFAEGNVRMEIESAIFPASALFIQSGEEHRVIFAAQLQQLSAPSGDPATAVLTLNGKTAFLWTSYDTLLAAGFVPFDVEGEQQTRHLLEQQHEHLKSK